MTLKVTRLDGERHSAVVNRSTSKSISMKSGPVDLKSLLKKRDKSSNDGRLLTQMHSEYQNCVTENVNADFGTNSSLAVPTWDQSQ